MAVQNAHILYAVIALAGGIAVPFPAAINASYGQSIGNVHWASMTLCAVAFITILAVALLSGTARPPLAALPKVQWWHLTAGCFFAIYVVSITFVAPKIGIANAIIFVVVAQMFTAVAIDHFGILGAKVQHLDWKRALGLAFLVVGVALTRSGTGQGTNG